VRRPGIVKQVDEDLDIIQNLAVAASHRWDLAEQYDPVTLAEEFAESLRAELDYMNEGRSAERFAANFAASADVHIPRVFWETTASRVLTLERIRGMKVNDLQALDAAGVDRRQLAHRAANIMIKMVFDDGFFHGDPHPGNFFVEQDGRIGLIDFGLVGTLDQRTQDRLVDVLVAISSQDADQLVDVVLDFGVARQRVDRSLLRRDLEHLLSRYYNASLGETSLQSMIDDALAIVRRHQLQVPAEFALLLKVATMSEGLGAQLDPEFRLTDVVASHAQRLLVRRYSLDALVEHLGRAGLDAAGLGIDLPRQLRRLLADLERGDIEVGVRPARFEPLIQKAEQLVNRLVLGVVAASFIVGLAGLTAVYRPPGRDQFAGFVFAVGFLVAAAIGAYLAISIVRSGRR